MARKSDADMLMDLVPASGDAIGNITLLDKLEWSEGKYWSVREKLLQQGRLERGRGKGGSVRRPEQSAALSAAKLHRSEKEGNLSDKEDALYAPLIQVLEKEWVRERRIESNQIAFEITANQGKKLTGGTWTRPDLTAVSVRKFQHLPGEYIDVWTFEVKAVNALDVTAVFEAASHASRATRSYALLQTPQSIDSKTQELIDRCEREATRLRVGLITFSKADEFATWETIVEAPRLETAPEELDEFLGYLSDRTKKILTLWR